MDLLAECVHAMSELEYLDLNTTLDRGWVGRWRGVMGAGFVHLGVSTLRLGFRVDFVNGE
jgi:hypothetical protein